VTTLRVRRLAIAIWALGLVLSLGGLAFARLGTSGTNHMTILIGLSQGVALVAVGLVGLVVALKQPKNAIGWIYLAFWVATGILSLSTGYGHWATVVRPAAFGGEFAVWLHDWAWVPLLCLLLSFPFLLFPDGHLPSARWRYVAWWVVIASLLWSVAFAFEGHDYTDARGVNVPNPYTPDSLVPFFDLMRNVVAGLFISAMILCLTSLYVRFRRAAGMERAQIKWLFLAGAVTLGFLLLPGSHGGGGWIDVLMGFVLVLIPISVCVAILRYRLYDIDRIISRTTSYAIVTGLLIATFALIVALASSVLGPKNQLGVAIATLVAAALARPVLARVQRIVDRRFDRARYDAQRTIDAFGGRLREAVDPDAVVDDLLEVVRQSLQPEHSGVTILVSS
jgi:hypothetical protein